MTLGLPSVHAQLPIFCVMCISNEGVGYLAEPLLAMIREQTLGEERQTAREQKECLDPESRSHCEMHTEHN